MENTYVFNETPSPAPPVLALTLSRRLPMDLRACEMDGDRIEFMLINPPKYVVDPEDCDPFDN